MATLQKIVSRAWAYSLVFSISILCLHSLASAQAFPYGRSNFTAGTQGMIVVADFNGDSIPDVAVSDGSNNVIQILLGSTNGSLVSAGSYSTGPAPKNLVAADFNHDKKIDLAVLNINSGTISVLLGNGDGTFQSRTDYPVGQQGAGLVSGDFNGDGKIDLATISVADSAVEILAGDGRGGFEVGGLIFVSSDPMWLATGDVNGDGKLDLITLNNNYSNSQIVSLVNKGDGTFTQVASQATQASALAIGDFNQDGKVDVILAGYSLYLSLGNGDGSFQAPSTITNAPQNLYNVQTIQAADLNRDKKLDIVLPGIWIMLGNGDGTFQNPVIAPTPNAIPMGLADMNGDGSVDLVSFVAGGYQSSGAVAVMLGNGKGGFMNTGNVALAQSSSSGAGAVSADFNGDGKLDLAVVEESYPPQVSVELGTGHGTFGKPLVTSLTSTAGYSVILSGDFNGDQKQDLLVVDNGNQGFQVLMGRGNGQFDSPVDNNLTFPFSSVAVGDFNKDGKADLAVLAGNGANGMFLAIYLSNGDGTFTASSQYVIYPDSYIAVADVNGDGDLDLVVTSQNYSLLTFLGNGDGTFREPLFGPSTFALSGAAIGDFNDDGKPDIALVTNNYPYDEIAFFAGNGDGTFQSPVYSNTGEQYLQSVVLGDFNGDGKLDVVATFQECCDGASVFVIPGNGDGTFGSALEYDAFSVVYAYSGFVVGDFNSDGVTDLGMGAELTSNNPLMLLYLSGPETVLVPNALSFGKEPVGKTGPPQKVSLTNSGNSQMKISSIKIAGDFVEKDNCGKSLAIGGTCTIEVSFKPKTKGKLVGTLSITDNAPASPQKVSLSGTGE